MWIIEKKTGSCLIHRNYGKLEKIDSNLFSGLLTAIINFSQEITGGDFIKSVAMGRNKFFYNLSENFIVAISMDEKYTAEDAKSILEIILDSFISEGYAEKALESSEVWQLHPFEEAIDKIVQTFENSIILIRDDTGIVEEMQKKAEEVVNPLLAKKKEEIEKAIENAEWALSGGNYKEAVKCFKTAADGFTGIQN